MKNKKANVHRSEPAKQPDDVKRIMIVANKKWEAAPLEAVLLETKATPQAFKFLPVTVDSRPHPRRVLSIEQTVKGKDEKDEQKEIAQVEIWCIEDWLPKEFSSYTNRKIDLLPSFFSWLSRPADFVVAFGTAAYLGDTSYNGCVVMGANAFIFNAWSNQKPTTPEPWDDSAVKRPIKATLSPAFFKPKLYNVDETLRYEVEARFLVPPLNPALRPIILSAYNHSALGVVNIINYDDYVWADDAAVAAFHSADKYNPIGSVETTHAIIRIQSTAPFLFVSGIVDRVGQFNAETAPRAYAQNFAGAHNAGVLAAWLIPRIVKFLLAPPS